MRIEFPTFPFNAAQKNGGNFCNVISCNVKTLSDLFSQCTEFTVNGFGNVELLLSVSVLNVYRTLCFDGKGY